MYLYLHNNIKKSPVDFNSKNELKKWNWMEFNRRYHIFICKISYIHLNVWKLSLQFYFRVRLFII